MGDGGRPTVVIVGAGFAGLWATKALRRAAVDVVLIDRHNYHTFFPLLYQVAAAELDANDITYPVRTILRGQDNARFVLAEVTGLDRAAKVVHTTEGPLAYDYVVLGPGSSTVFFGVEGAERHSLRLRTLEDALVLRNHVLTCLEEAERSHDAGRDVAMTFVVVGAGPTGAEFSGALQELLRGPLRKDHPHLDLTKARIVLVEAGPRVLSVYPDRLSDYAARRLQRMGIELLLNTTVSKVDAAGVVLGDGSRIDAGTVLWTAGVGGPADLAEWHLETARGNRATVEPTLSLSGDAAVFVAGDAALPDGSFAPMVAQNASQQGTLAARNILRSISGEPLEPYTYRDLGNMAVIGRNAAVVHLFNKIAFTGYLAWIMWLGLHLIKLVGFRNRLAALVSWSGDYLFRDRVARLILPDGRSADEP